MFRLDYLIITFPPILWGKNTLELLDKMQQLLSLFCNVVFKYTFQWWIGKEVTTICIKTCINMLQRYLVNANKYKYIHVHKTITNINHNQKVKRLYKSIWLCGLVSSLFMYHEHFLLSGDFEHVAFKTSAQCLYTYKGPT